MNTYANPTPIRRGLLSRAHQQDIRFVRTVYGQTPASVRGLEISEINLGGQIATECLCGLFGRSQQC